MFRRNLKEKLIDALSDTPVVLLSGARQVGKSTLAESLINDRFRAQYQTFDDPTLLAAAKSDPTAYLESLQTPVILDEIQRVPELLLPIKREVDRDHRAGQYLLTGSANVMLLPTIADSLAGRVELLTLRPLSQGELADQKENFIDLICADDFKPPKPVEHENRQNLFARALVGGYPEAVKRKQPERRAAWFRSYIATLLQRDVRDLANIEGLTDLPRLLTIMAGRSGGLLNIADISRAVGFAQTTLKRYTTLLNQVFLIETLPGYSGSLAKRMMKTPKLFFSDTGLLAHLQGLSWEKIKYENSLAGMLIENFVFAELRKQSAWNGTPIEMFHFRTAAGHEVDLVLEIPSGEVIGIEVKTAAAVGPDAFKGLRTLKEAIGKKFKRGIVLYTGEEAVAFSADMFAVPIQVLWCEYA